MTRLDRKEPDLNSVGPGDELADVLSESSRHQLEDWLQRNETSTFMIRAGVPKTWIVGDKTGRALSQRNSR